MEVNIFSIEFKKKNSEYPNPPFPNTTNCACHLVCSLMLFLTYPFQNCFSFSTKLSFCNILTPANIISLFFFVFFFLWFFIKLSPHHHLHESLALDNTCLTPTKHTQSLYTFFFFLKTNKYHHQYSYYHGLLRREWPIPSQPSTPDTCDSLNTFFFTSIFEDSING